MERDLFNAQYENLISFSTGLLIKAKAEWISPKDLVHDAYIEAMASLDTWDLNKVKSKIVDAFNYEKRRFGLIHDTALITKDTCLYCKKCKELMPIGAFRIRRRESGAWDVETTCKDCEYKAAVRSQKKNRESAKASFKKYNQKNKEARQIWLKRWMETEREKLSDKYIIRVLQQSRRYTTEYIRSHPELWEQKREEIKNKNKSS